MSETTKKNDYLEFDEDVLGGAELHVKFVRHEQGPGIMLEFTPPHRPDGKEEGIPDINARLSGVCRSYILDMEDQARYRLLALVEKDGGMDRMLYRLVVAGRITDDKSRRTRVLDRIDPEFLEIDAGLAGRALACRQEIERVLAGGKPRPLPGEPVPGAERHHRGRRPHDRAHGRGTGAGPMVAQVGVAGDENPERSEPVFEVLGTPQYPPDVPELSAEEVREGLLRGQEFLVLQMQVVGTIEKGPDRESIAMDYLAAINQNAVSSEWMRERIGLLASVCEQTIMATGLQTTRRLFASLRKRGEEEKCLYRLSVWAGMMDDGKPRYSIRDEIDPVFLQEDPEAGMRAAEARRLAAKVMEESG